MEKLRSAPPVRWAPLVIKYLVLPACQRGPRCCIPLGTKYNQSGIEFMKDAGLVPTGALKFEALGGAGMLSSLARQSRPMVQSVESKEADTVQNTPIAIGEF
jgi:hypothetical protein